MVGPGRFELPTSTPPAWEATNYNPVFSILLLNFYRSTFGPKNSSVFYRKIKTNTLVITRITPE